MKALESWFEPHLIHKRNPEKYDKAENEGIISAILAQIH